MIANFYDLKQYIREILVENPEKFEQVSAELLSSENIKKEKNEELAKIKAEIDIRREKIKDMIGDSKVFSDEDKIKISSEIKKYNESREGLVADIFTRFTAMSLDAKVLGVGDRLLRKCFLNEFDNKKQSVFDVNANEEVIFDAGKFEKTEFYNNIRHVRDYLRAYISDNPEEVKDINYFNKKHASAKYINNLYGIATKYFSKKNEDFRENQKFEELLKNSREGIKVLKKYPEQNLQVVQLLDQMSLNIEAAEMNNCVSTHSLEECNIISVRDDIDGKPCYPHVTMEIDEYGCVKEVKGNSNSIIKPIYIPVVRKYLTEEMGIKDLATDNRIYSSERVYIGYVEGKDGKTHDLLNLPEKGVEILSLPISNKGDLDTILSFKGVKSIERIVPAKIDNNFLKKMAGVPGIKEIDISNAIVKESELDLRPLNGKKIFLGENINLSECDKVVFPDSVKSNSFPSIEEAPKRLDLSEMNIDRVSFFCTNVSYLEELTLPKKASIVSFSGSAVSSNSAKNLDIKGRGSDIGIVSFEGLDCKNYKRVIISGGVNSLNFNSSLMPQSLDISSSKVKEIDFSSADFSACDVFKAPKTCKEIDFSDVHILPKVLDFSECRDIDINFQNADFNNVEVFNISKSMMQDIDDASIEIPYEFIDKMQVEGKPYSEVKSKSLSKSKKDPYAFLDNLGDDFPEDFEDGEYFGDERFDDVDRSYMSDYMRNKKRGR